MALAVLDANLLLYAFNPHDPSHAAVAAWSEKLIDSQQVVAIPMLAIAALIRVSTNPRLDRIPERMQEVLRFVERLLALPNVRILHTDQAHWVELKRVLESGVHGPTAIDAPFAALALQHDGTFHSTDKHFRRFPRLRWQNPLEER
ncbi:MAG: TA system VapC family ribonuclease toxin [Janthinobacterium lividum]